MLSYAVMGALALAILWVNTLLVAAAALKELGPIRAWKRAAAQGMVRGTVGRGDGADGALASLEVEQVGRATDDGGIVFADRGFVSQVFGGTLRLASGGELVVPPTPAESASTTQLSDGVVEVWLDDRALAAALACPSREALEEALLPAKKARGFGRTVRAAIGGDTEVFVVGALRGEGDSLSLAGPPRLVSSVSPAAWANRKGALVIAFVVAELATAAACTTLALASPAFGTVSKIGGALCLAFFLGVQALGTALRDAVRSPARRSLRGRWERGAAGGAAERAPS